MHAPAFHGDDPAAAWQSLFDFLEAGREGRSSADEWGRELADRVGSDGLTRAERERARYQEVFSKLTAYFDSRGCDDSEGCASETILRVAAKCGSVELMNGVEPMGFFYGCARNVMHEVYREWKRRAKGRRELLKLPQPEASEIKEVRERCLDECIDEKLDDEERDLILDYYKGERSAKIEARRELARKFEMSLNALRIAAHRIRKKLEPCVARCLETATASMVPQ